MVFWPFCGLSCSSLGLSRPFDLSRGPGGPFGPIQRWPKALFRALSRGHWRAFWVLPGGFWTYPGEHGGSFGPVKASKAHFGVYPGGLRPISKPSHFWVYPGGLSPISGGLWPILRPFCVYPGVWGEPI